MTSVARLREVKARVDLRLVVAPQVDGDRPVFVPCPWHHDAGRNNCAVYADGAYCFRCGGRGDHYDYLQATKGWTTEEIVKYLEGFEGEPIVKAAEVDLGPVSWSYVEELTSNLSRGYSQRLTWLLARGLTPKTIAAARLGHTGRAFAIPILGTNGECLTVRFRRDDELVGTDGPKFWGMKGRNRVLLYNAQSVQPGAPLVLCEGELDALLVSQEIGPAVSFTNGKAAFDESYLPLFANVSQLFFCFDQDAASVNRALELAPKFAGVVGDLRLVQWPARRGKDATELIVTRGRAAFQQALEQALPLKVKVT